MKGEDISLYAASSFFTIFLLFYSFLVCISIYLFNWNFKYRYLPHIKLFAHIFIIYGTLDASSLELCKTEKCRLACLEEIRQAMLLPLLMVKLSLEIYWKNFSPWKLHRNNLTSYNTNKRKTLKRPFVKFNFSSLLKILRYWSHMFPVHLVTILFPLFHG